MVDILSNGVGPLDLAVLIPRVGVGTFFAISGWHKLFNAERHAKLVATLVEDRVPWVKGNQWLVPGTELLAGVNVILGALTSISALTLLVICAVACKCEGASKVAKYKPIDACDTLDDYLYLPEVIYLLILAGLFFAGGGRFSLDYFFLRSFYSV